MSVLIRPMGEEDLPAAVAIYRDSFRTFLNIPDRMVGDSDFVVSRFRADPEASFAAEFRGELVGTHFGVNWGSVAIHGPTTIRPRGWTGGAGGLLLEASVAHAERRWGSTFHGGFTFADSARHASFFLGHGFWPRWLTAILSSPIRKEVKAPAHPLVRCSELSDDQREELLHACADLTSTLHPGLDVRRDLLAAQAQHLGETLALWEGSRLTAFGLCHLGLGSEAGSRTLYLKFAAVRPGPQAPATFERLIDACLALAAERGLSRMNAGCNLAREGPFRLLQARGFAITFQGVSLHRPNEPAYNRPDVFVIDDWR